MALPDFFPERDENTGELVDMEQYRRSAPAYNTVRTLTGSAEKLVLNDGVRGKVDKRQPAAWQTAAWQFFDQIGEIKFAFSLVGQIISRVRVYPAYVKNPESAPIKISEYLTRDDPDVDERALRAAMREAEKISDDLHQNASHSLSNLLREAAINLSVPGEFYILNHNGKWHIASGDELVKAGNSYQLKSDRSSSTEVENIDPSAFVARIWRSHPRYSKEADSSMMGVLDQCEQLVILDQAMRVLTRSRLNAGALFIPDGVGASNVEEAIAAAATDPINDETAMTTTVPLILRGPAMLGKEIKLIDLSRRVDSEMLEQQTRALDRVLAGVDIPKDIVQGLSNARYSNAVIITDEMFKSHVEPLMLLLVDALTSVILVPSLIKAGVAPEIAHDMVLWYDPSDIVTRPDRSQAANDGYDRQEISGRAWRAARGFTDLDAPSPEELVRRLAVNKAQIPPEMSGPMIETLNPDFFAKLRGAAHDSADMPAEVKDLMQPPGVPGVPTPEAAGEGSADDLGGGDVSQGGFMPPPPGG